MARDSGILSTGGAALLLLPIFLFSYNTQGVSLAYNLTNNINQFNLSTGGQIVGLRPYFFLEDVFNVDYEGDFSLVNFEPRNLLMANTAALSKAILLPGVGNRTTLYARLYSFHAPSYDPYGLADAVFGDSIRLYTGKFLFMPDARVRYKYFFSDSITSYLEPQVKLGLKIPLPYAFFTPSASAGLRIYGEESTPFFRTSAQLFFPLSIDFSISTTFTFGKATPPDSAFIVPATYIDDPFFEEENIEDIYDLELGINRSDIRERAFIEFRGNLFRKNFLEVNGEGRTDEGIGLSLQYTKFMSSTFVFHVTVGTLLNSSTRPEFDFMKNDLELIFELIL